MTSSWKSSSASWPDLRRRRRTDRGPDRARAAVGWPATPPACAPPRRRSPAAGTSLQEAAGLAGVQRSGWKISRRRPGPSATGSARAARCTGSSSDSRRSLSAAPAYSRSACAQRQVLRLALRRQPRGVGRQEGEGALLVLAVLGQIEVHRPTRFQAGWRAFRKSWRR